MQERTQRKITLKQGTVNGEALMTKGKPVGIYTARTLVVNEGMMRERCGIIQAHFRKTLKKELRRNGIPRYILSFETPDHIKTGTKTVKVAVTVTTLDHAIGDFKHSKGRMKCMLTNLMELLLDAIDEADLSPTEKCKPKATE